MQGCFEDVSKLLGIAREEPARPRWELNDGDTGPPAVSLRESDRHVLVCGEDAGPATLGEFRALELLVIRLGDYIAGKEGERLLTDGPLRDAWKKAFGTTKGDPGRHLRYIIGKMCERSAEFGLALIQPGVGEHERHGWGVRTTAEYREAVREYRELSGE